MNTLVVDMFYSNLIGLGCGINNFLRTIIDDQLFEVENMLSQFKQSCVQLDLDGSRWVAMNGRMPQTSYIEIELEGKIVAPVGLSSILDAFLDHRSIQAYRIGKGLWTPTDLNTSNLSPHRPLLLNVDRGLRGPQLLRSDNCAPQAFMLYRKLGTCFRLIETEI